MKVISTRNRSRSARSAFARLTACLPLCGSLTAPHARAETGAGALNRLSLGELGALEVTSVTKDPQPVRDAAATIYVITRQDILRSGATSVPEALRLAPNLLVTQLTASDYALSARGFGGNPDAQNFPNKLLVLIDGRSVYSPLFSGIYADTLEVMLEDIERIEVTSGPGATLWGANAMNGVINVITRPAVATQDEIASLGLGNREQRGGFRHGGCLGESAHYRVYGRGFVRGETEFPDGAGRNDEWHKGQGGFRVDVARGSDDVTLQGDAYRGKIAQDAIGWLRSDGVNLLSRWQRATTTGALQAQAYVDVRSRDAPGDRLSLGLRTWDFELQQTFDLGTRHRVVWGGGYRLNEYTIDNTDTLAFMPDARTLSILNLFVQDTVRLSRTLRLTLGVKLEDHTYTDWMLQPELRLAWRMHDAALLWASVARAVRATTPFDRDVIERFGGQVFLTGNRDFRSERVTAYEIGMRSRPWPALNLEATLFLHDYDDLRTVEPGQTVPLTWRNGLEGHTYGIQAWARWEIADWWRITPGVTLLRKRLKFEPGAVALLGTGQAANDPSGHGTLTSSMHLGARSTLDLTPRHVGRLADPELDSYTELAARASWRASDTLEFSVSGFNLLHDHHAEYPAPQAAEIGRSVLVALRWRLP